MAAVNEGTAGEYRPGEHRDRAELPEISFRRCADKNDRETLSLRRRWRNLARDNRRSASRPRHRRRRSARCAARSKKSADRLLSERGVLEVDRWWQNLGGLARRTGRRRLPKHLDQSEQSG